MRSVSDRAPVTVSLMGGLGNQLFQFATGLQAARSADTSLQLDLAWFKQRLRRSGGLILRPYELATVAADIPLAPLPGPGLAATCRHARDFAMRRLPAISAGPLSHMIYEKGPGLDERVLRASPGTHLSGYFSSWRYFTGVADDIRSRIRGAVSTDRWTTEELARVSDMGPIGLHIRRGDYLSLKETYGHVSPVYYSRAIKALADMGFAGPVWLFSDEPVQAAEWVQSAVTIEHVVRPSSDSTSVDSLVVMSKVKALVTANSTFSWWAAFLEDSEGRPIIAPRPTWADPSLAEPRDSLLPTWLTIDCRA